MDELHHNRAVYRGAKWSMQFGGRGDLSEYETVRDRIRNGVGESYDADPPKDVVSLNLGEPDEGRIGRRGSKKQT
jgi:hypothetical protein